MLKDYLNKRLDEIRGAIDKATDIEAVKKLTAEAEAIRSQLADIDAAARSAEPPANAQLVNGKNVATATMQTAARSEDEDVLASMEYRKAFRAYVEGRGAVKMPAEFRGARYEAPTSVQGGGVLVPTTIMNEIIRLGRSRYGNIYNKVRKISVPGGVEFPTTAFRAQFHWISESTVSPRQGAGAVGKVSFSYFQMECRLAETFLAVTVGLPMFEQEYARIVAEAFFEAMDKAIVAGTGSGMPTGILNDARVTNVVTMTAAQFSDWKEWLKRFFATQKMGYTYGDFIMTKATFDANIRTMNDSNNQPIAYLAAGVVPADGDALLPYGYFFGHDVEIVENTLGIADFDTASSGDVVAVFWQPDLYVVNNNMQMYAQQYPDHDRNEIVNKWLAILDGKAIDTTGYILIKKA